MEPGAPHHSIWQLDAAAWQAQKLIGPDSAPIRIANNDWSISPDGNTMAFVSQDDRNIWAVDLP
jgi:hypothetical protein